MREPSADCTVSGPDPSGRAALTATPLGDTPDSPPRSDDDPSLANRADDLAALQSALMRLYTDPAARSDAGASRSPRGGEADDAEGALRAWARDHAAPLESFARSLVNKRFGEVRKLLPASSKAFGESFHVWFQTYAARPIPGGFEPHGADAIAFAEFVLSHRALAPSEPLWLMDLLRFEADGLRFRSPRSVFRVCRYAWRVDLIAHRLLTDAPSRMLTDHAALSDRRSLLVIRARLRRNGRPRIFQWPM